jgi:type III restriction enzyme
MLAPKTLRGKQTAVSFSSIFGSTKTLTGSARSIFILVPYSRSALREGWDNPNVLQICALREIGTERERRQTIGRGLRLCVNQDGDRRHSFEVNTLTVIATESYEQFAENLQKEIEQDTGIRFGIVEEHQFAGIALTDATHGKRT